MSPGLLVCLLCCRKITAPQTACQQQLIVLLCCSAITTAGSAFKPYSHLKQNNTNFAIFVGPLKEAVDCSSYLAVRAGKVEDTTVSL